MGHNGHVNRLVLWLINAVQNSLHDFMFLDRSMPLVLSKNSCKAILTFPDCLLGNGVSVATIAGIQFIFSALLLVHLRVGSSDHFIDFLVGSLAHYRPETLALLEFFLAHVDCVPSWLW